MVLDHDAEETKYKLLYKQTTDEKHKEPFNCRREIRYIDAQGEKDLSSNKKSYFSKKITLLFYTLPVRFSKVNVIGRLE